MSRVFSVTINGNKVVTTDEYVIDKLLGIVSRNGQKTVLVNHAAEVEKDLERRRKRYGEKECVICSKSFVPRYETQRACSLPCGGKLSAQTWEKKRNA